MFSGWGVRTLSSDDAGFNPIGYHVGTIWPHDNAIIAAGMARMGFREESNRIALALIEAASYSRRRLPEAFAGFPRAVSRFPVPFPTACSPQAWATAAPFFLVSSMLGICGPGRRARRRPVDPGGGRPHPRPGDPRVRRRGGTWRPPATTGTSGWHPTERRAHRGRSHEGPDRVRGQDGPRSPWAFRSLPTGRPCAERRSGRDGAPGVAVPVQDERARRRRPHRPDVGASTRRRRPRGTPGGRSGSGRERGARSRRRRGASRAGVRRCGSRTRRRRTCRRRGPAPRRTSATSSPRPACRPGARRGRPTVRPGDASARRDWRNARPPPTPPSATPRAPSSSPLRSEPIGAGVTRMNLVPSQCRSTAALWARPEHGPGHVSPTAHASSGPDAEMPSRWVSPSRNGIGTCRHVEPSQCSTSPWRSHRSRSDHRPAAHTSSGATASTARISFNAVPGLGVGTAVHVEPSQCSISVREPNPPFGPQAALRQENPPAQASSGANASTAWRPLPWTPGLGDPTFDQPAGAQVADQRADRAVRRDGSDRPDVVGRGRRDGAELGEPGAHLHRPARERGAPRGGGPGHVDLQRGRARRRAAGRGAADHDHVLPGRGGVAVRVEPVPRQVQRLRTTGLHQRAVWSSRPAPGW